MIDKLESDRQPYSFKGIGTTLKEKSLAKLCEKTFLRLWSFPNVYRNQGGGKELCDLLVVFENHIILFSNKNIQFPNTSDLNIDWSRWAKKAILDSSKQVYGAERWIKKFPLNVFVDAECKHPLPISLPNMESAIFHRVIVANGASERCRQELGGSGSLMIHTDIIGEDLLKKIEDGGLPFSIGQVNPKKGFIHIFDDISAEIVLKTLDTITDFVFYLDKKEKFLQDKMIFFPGEEECLALYLSSINKNQEHDFILSPDTPLNLDFYSFEEGFWEDFVNSPERLAQLAADKISYSWDRLIEHFSQYILQLSDSREIQNQEKVIRFFAREPRFRRRMLCKSLFEVMDNTPPDKRAIRVTPPIRKNDPYFIFLLFPHPSYVSEDDYRKVRKEFLAATCQVTKYTFPDAKDIVGFSTESGLSDFRSEDAIYMDTRVWTKEFNDDAKQLQKDLEILVNITQKNYHESEYPLKKPRKRHKSKKLSLPII